MTFIETFRHAGRGLTKTAAALADMVSLPVRLSFHGVRSEIKQGGTFTDMAVGAGCILIILNTIGAYAGLDGAALAASWGPCAQWTVGVGGYYFGAATSAAIYQSTLAEDFELAPLSKKVRAKAAHFPVLAAG